MHRLSRRSHHGRPVPADDFDKHSRAAKFDNENVYAPLHALNEWLLKEVRESHARDSLALHVLQLRAHPPHTSMLSRYGGVRV